MDIIPLGGGFLSVDPTDAAEYFRIAMKRDFPDLAFERTFEEERVGWIITLPAQRGYTHGQVEARALCLQEDLWWKKDALVGYVLLRDSEELDE